MREERVVLWRCDDCRGVRGALHSDPIHRDLVVSLGLLVHGVLSDVVDDAHHLKISHDLSHENCPGASREGRKQRKCAHCTERGGRIYQGAIFLIDAHQQRIVHHVYLCEEDRVVENANLNFVWLSGTFGIQRGRRERRWRTRLTCIYIYIHI